MWLAAQIVRASGGDVSGLTVAVGALAVLATVVTALLGFRGTLRTADVQREANFDKRVDERLTRLEERNQFLESELARYRDMYAAAAGRLRRRPRPRRAGQEVRR
ncbi:hypothetical protein ACL02O_29285 [Micromonospora sp. MS34]|uniref:hypothetical protein n=1 Tax=Micromonospora sp. MS34 TaxID=3385971 RepID=UPI0039A09507